MIIRDPENKRLGVMVYAPIIQKQQQILSVAFIDNTDFFTEGPMCIEKMQ